MNLRSFIFLVLICMVWAANTIISRLVVADLAFPPIWFNTLRSAIVAIVMLPWLLPVPAQLWRVILVTFAIGGGGVTLVYIGLKDATASAASVVGLSSAPLTVIFAILILGEVVHWRRAAGIALTFAGVIVAIASPADMEASLGLIIIFCGAASGAIGAVFLKQLAISPLRLQAWSGFSSALLLLPVSFYFESNQIQQTRDAGWPIFAAILFAAIGVSVLAHTMYFRILQKHDANVVAPLMLMTPVLTILGAAYITGEPVGLQLVVGGLIALVGVLVILMRPGLPFLKPFMSRPRD